jgi:signal transduction histidine kinase
VYRIYGEEVDHFGSSEGLSGDVIYGLFEDKEGNVWVATSKGLDCFRDLPITTFSTREGLAAPAVASVQAMHDGAIWLAGENALDILGPGLGQGHVRSIQTGKGLPGDQVTSLFEDHAGRHWVGIDNTLNIYENGRFTRIFRRNGSPMGMILGITEDRDNNLWVLSLGPQRMLIRIFDRKVQEEIPTPQIPAAGSLVADPRGAVWLGLLNGDLARYQKGRIDTFRFEHPSNARANQVLLNPDGSILGATTYGLIGWSNGKQQTLNAQNGLPCDGVNGMVEDGSGALWLYMQCAMVEIAKSDLQRWWAQPNVRLQPRVFDVFDGLQLGLYAPFESQAARTLDGRLWFANSGVPQMIDPAHLARNLIAPSVHVEQIIADRRDYALQSEVRLPAGTRDVEIDYTALSFTVPQKVRFRYKLEGRDMDWEEAGTRRQTFYTDLRPGPYRFHVIACNNDGVWNNDGAVVNFNVAAAWYQSSWFRSSIAAALLLGLWGIYQLRLHRLANQFNIRLEERVGERTRIARDLHDTLLQSIQGLMLHFQTGIDQLPGRPAEARKTLEIALDRADQAIAEGRDAVQGLRASTVETNDLAAAIRVLGEELRAEGSNQNAALFEMEVEGTPRNLHPILRDEVYRIAGEALRNAFRHARAQRIEVEILYGERWLRLRVRDDGKGIDPELLSGDGPAGHYGLHGMRERAKLVGGKLAVWSKPDSGTEVELSIPASTAYAKPARHRSWLSGKLSGKGTDFKNSDVKETKTNS